MCLREFMTVSWLIRLVRHPHACVSHLDALLAAPARALAASAAFRTVVCSVVAADVA